MMPIVGLSLLAGALAVALARAHGRTRTLEAALAGERRRGADALALARQELAQELALARRRATEELARQAEYARLRHAVAQLQDEQRRTEPFPATPMMAEGSDACWLGSDAHLPAAEEHDLATGSRPDSD